MPGHEQDKTSTILRPLSLHQWIQKFVKSRPAWGAIDILLAYGKSLLNGEVEPPCKDSKGKP